MNKQVLPYHQSLPFNQGVFAGDWSLHWVVMVLWGLHCVHVLPSLGCSGWVWAGQWPQPGSQLGTAAWHCGTAAAQTAAACLGGKPSEREQVKSLCDLLKVCTGICRWTSKFEISNREMIHKSGDHIAKWRRNFCCCLFLYLYLFFFPCAGDEQAT